MPRCEYSYYVTLLRCNQFYRVSTGGQSSHGVGGMASLASSKNRHW